jgi:hypothetical protein
MERTFYLPTNSGSIAHYFNRAIILPSKYYTNKPEDIQDSSDQSLILSFNKWSKKSDCALEIILTDLEFKELQKISDYLFLSKFPIPTSRIKRIWFSNRNQMETTIWNINNGAAFVPDRLVSVDENFNFDSCSEIELKENQHANSKDEISDKIKYFDIILGGLAFMRIGGKSFMNYSFNYFSTLSFFNSLIEEQTNKAARDKGLTFSNKFLGLFSKNESEWLRWRKYIFKNIELHDIQTLAEKEGEKIEMKFGAVKIDSINPKSHLYELAILATYGNNKNKSTEDLVTDLTNGGIYSEKVEEVAILFGLNTGYSRLRNKYKCTIKESVVKFRLESKLDYYIIESVFQYVFNNNHKNYTFDYIDSWCPENKKFETLKGYEVYRILDTSIIAKKKQTPLEIFLEQYSRDFYSAINKSITPWMPSFAKIDENEAINYFDKQLRGSLMVVIEGIQSKIEKNIQDELSSKEQDNIEFFNSEIESLKLNLTKLNEENLRLNTLLSDLNNQQFTQLSETKNTNNDSIKEINADDISVDSNVDIENSVFTPIIVGESDDSKSEENYDTSSIPSLKKIAKEKMVKSKTKLDSAQLINLIENTPPTLL